MTESFSALVREKWASLLRDGFDITSETANRVALESETVQVIVDDDPRGEIDVYVFARGRKHYEGWMYYGMVGRASVGRLLELALAEMRAEPAMLKGDVAFFDRLATQDEATSRAWTAYSAGRGPRPKRLP